MNCTGNKLPLTYDLVYYRGDTFKRTIRLRSLNENGTPGPELDLSGCTVLSQVREYTDGKILTTIDAQVDPDQVTNKGQIHLVMDTTFTSYEGEVGVWDMEVTWPDTTKVTYLKGKVINDLDVSHV